MVFYSKIKSEHKIDKVHLKYWEECIDKNYTPKHQKYLVSFTPNKVNELFNSLYS
ncbi:hypothetical protein [uncultured Gammaproteobacteria bacterium]|nr:hypothetical protein [uncultured Gammaproteobacteria bacterium]CAC9957268.1 hypothetical protein [uncultured Gammaproteobacteria bacterium]